MQAALAAVHDLAAAGGQFPLLASWLAQPAGPSADEQFSLGLGFLLDGITSMLAGPLPGAAAGAPADGAERLAR